MPPMYAQTAYNPNMPQPMMGQPVVYQPSQPMVVVSAPAIVGDHPMQTVCPNCRASIVTNVVHSTGGVTWLIAGGLCLLG